MSAMKRALGLLNAEWLFFLAYALVLSSNIFSSLDIWEEALNLLDYAGIGICALIILANFRKYTWKHWLFLAVCVVCACFSGYKLWIKTAALIMAAINLELSNIVKKDLFIRMFFVILVITLNSFGLVDEAVRYRGESVRHSLGFGHPNVLGFQIAALAFDFAYLWRTHPQSLKKKMVVLAAIGAAVFIYAVSGSRTATIAMGLLVFYLLFETWINKILRAKIVKRFVKVFFVIMFAISMGFALFRVDDPSNKMVQTVDRTTAGRVKYSAYYVKKYGVTPFGEYVPESEKDSAVENGVAYQPFDNFYLAYLYRCGVVFMLLWAATMYVTMDKLYKKEDYALIAFLLILMIYALMENFVLRADMCALVFAIGIAGKKRAEIENHAEK